jgi:UDP-2,3-diacylglucosamine hydrolase
VTALFVSDVHLDATRPAATAAFLRFLSTDAARATALFVLGDLFEAWVGDDDDDPLAAAVAAALRGLTDGGTRVAFMHGNRDFLVGEAFARASGIELLPESHVEEIEGTPTLLLHGDTLCTGDVAYLQFRSQVRAPAWQQAFLAQPLAARREFAARARAQSRMHTATAPETLMDVAPDAVRAALASSGVRRLVHGHVHRPAIHSFDAGGAPAERFVLGDWYDQGSVLEITRDRAALSAIRVR